MAADGRPDLGGVFAPIERPRVLERITAAARYRIAAIVAPAGFGKSVAVRQYLTTQSAAIVYEVTRENASLIPFVRGFVEAFGTGFPGLAQSLPLALQHASTSQRAGHDLALWMRVHLHDMHDLIVLDDIHLCDDDPEVSKFLSALVEMATGPRWLISSRSTGNLPIASWLAYGVMDLTIDAVDLRFTLDEARENARATRVAVRDDELRAILDLVEGWPTALSFALRSSTRAADLRAVSASTREMAYRYLTEQVYESLNAEARDFLRFAALLPRLDLRYAAAAKFDRAAAIIADLRERVVFISAIDATTFRLHDLFRDFIRRQLELEGTECFHEALCFVGTILESVGEPGFALERYIEAKSPSHIRRILAKDGLELIDIGRADIVERALAALGKSKIDEASALLGVRAAIEHYHGRPVQAERLYERALEDISNEPIRRTIAIRYSRMLVETQRGPAIPLLQALLANDGIPEGERSELLGMLAIHHAISGNLEEAQKTIAAALTASELEANELRARIYGRACGIAMFAKDRDSVDQYGQEAIRLALEGDHFSIAGRIYQLICANSYWSAQNRAFTNEYALHATHYAMKSGDVYSWLVAIAYQYCCCVERGDIDRLVALDDDFKPLESHASINATACRQFARAMRSAWSGDFTAAHQIMLGVAPTGLFRQGSFDRYVRLAIFFALDERLADAKHALAEAERAHLDLRLDAPGEYDTFTSGQRWLILAQYAIGRKTAAARRLRSLPMSAPGLSGFDTALRGLLDDDDALFHEGARHMQSQCFGGVATLLQTISTKLSEERNMPSAGLTATEVSVLRSMAAGRSNKAIAEEQHRTINTVRTHVSAVLRKLQAKTRGEAVVTARQRAIIDL